MANGKRPLKTSLSHLQLLYLCLTLLILVAAGGYVIRHTQQVAHLSETNQQELTRTLVNTRVLQQRHAWLLGVLRQLTQDSVRLSAEFELMQLDATRRRDTIRNVYIQLQRIQTDLDSPRGQSFAERLAPIRDYLKLLLQISHQLLFSESGLAPARAYGDTEQALSAVIFEIRRLEASVQTEAEMLAGRVSHTVERVEKNGERMTSLFASIDQVLVLTLIGLFLVLAGSTAHLFLIFQQRMRALAQYALSISTQRLLPPPFKSKDPTGRLASQMFLMARRIRRLFREAQEATETAETLAHYDPLTGLENRRLFAKNLARAFADTERGSEHWSLLMLDLDGFKAVNDSLGHDAGDQMLKVVAQRLLDTVRDGDHLARMGGDEFALLTRRQSETLPQLPQRILSVLREPIMLERHRLQISTSIGIARVGVDGRNIQEVLRNADMALYKAKAEGKDCFHYYSEELNEKAQRKIALISALREAVEMSRFDLYFQCKVDLKDGSICGLEALIRWPLGDGRFEPPDRFIPVAEETGLILPIGEWVLRRACEEGARLRAEGQPMPIAVNLSARQFVDDAFIEKVEAILHTSGLPPQLLELEITETLLLDNIDLSVKVLRELKAMGIKISIDDFGTGFSSLEYLKSLPVDVLKVDRTFVKGLPDDDRDAAIVETVINLGHRLGLKVVSEGVEQSVQASYLRDMACDIGQGTLFSYPLPLAQLDLSQRFPVGQQRQRA